MKFVIGFTEEGGYRVIWCGTRFGMSAAEVESEARSLVPARFKGLKDIQVVTSQAVTKHHFEEACQMFLETSGWVEHPIGVWWMERLISDNPEIVPQLLRSGTPGPNRGPWYPKRMKPPEPKVEKSI